MSKTRRLFFCFTWHGFKALVRALDPGSAAALSGRDADKWEAAEKGAREKTGSCAEKESICTKAQRMLRFGFAISENAGSDRMKKTRSQRISDHSENGGDMRIFKLKQDKFLNERMSEEPRWISRANLTQHSVSNCAFI